MCCCQNTGILHVTFQIPELSQANTRYIDNIRRIRNRYFRIGPFESRNKRKDEVEEVVIECEERDHLRRCSQLLVTWKTVFVVL